MVRGELPAVPIDLSHIARKPATRKFRRIDGPNRRTRLQERARCTQSFAPAANSIELPPGDILEVEKLAGDVGDSVVLDDVLLVAGGDGVRIGRPNVDGASVTARITGQHRGEKILVFRYRPKKRVRVRRGHRQYVTRLQIDKISGEDFEFPEETHEEAAPEPVAEEGGSGSPKRARPGPRLRSLPRPIPSRRPTRRTEPARKRRRLPKRATLWRPPVIQARTQKRTTPAKTR